jgi:pimeloyl-ACP methyl ester carboxylesterase
MNIKPFTVSLRPAVLDDLRERLENTRWPDEVSGAGWDYGTNLGYMRSLIDYWHEEFDWPAQERALNAFPHFRAEIDGWGIHFIHVRGRGPKPMPLVMTHGWPSSFVEMLKILPLLADPGAHGGDPADAFDVVVPSLPGFGFSQPRTVRGPARAHQIWRRLMLEGLGHPRFAAQGGDLGARVTTALGQSYPDNLIGLHLSTVDLAWPTPEPAESELTEAEKDYLERVRHWEEDEGGYIHIQATRPQSLAYGLNDSPAGLAAWIVEKWRAWSDCGGGDPDLPGSFTRDELLTNITLYWATQTINSSMRYYYERRHDPEPAQLKLVERIQVPTAVAVFPAEKELRVPREWAERSYNIQRWTDIPRGGRFAALEQPELLAEDIRAFFRGLRM